MTTAISIHRSGEHVNLKSGKYSVYIPGGWRVELGNFSISLKHNETQETINSERPFWRVQSLISKKRAKRIFVIDIPKSGEYVLEFQNPESINVRHSNLFISSLFEEPIPNENLEIYINDLCQE